LHHLFGRSDTSGHFIQSSFWRDVRMTKAVQIYNEDDNDLFKSSPRRFADTVIKLHRDSMWSWKL